MKDVILSYPDGSTQHVTLVGVPRVGDYVRLRATPPEDSSFEVEHVLWADGPEPNVVVAVRRHRDTRTLARPAQPLPPRGMPITWS